MRHGGIAVVIWHANSPHAEHLAQRMGAELYCIDFVKLKKRSLLPIRYILQWLATWVALFRQRPDCVVVINTPAFAPLCVGIFCFVFRTPYILNVHGHSLMGKWAWAVPLQRILARYALVNIVQQDLHQCLYQRWGAPIIRLERAPMSAPATTTAPALEQGHYVITVVSTFASDEPLELVVDAARQVSDVHIYVLGDKARAPKELLAQAPSNVTFTGFLRGRDYWDQLNASHAIMTLTTTPYSMVSGGIEGMALKKPLILSRQPALTAYFTKGAVFVDHSVAELVDAIKQVRAQHSQLENEIGELLAEKQARWDATLSRLMELIGARKWESSLSEI